MAQTQLLPGPYEWLELEHAETVDIIASSYEYGLASIHPKGTPDGFMKQIAVLRLHYDADASIPGVHYVDVSSQTLIAQIAPALANIIDARMTIRVTATGQAPKKRFTVQIL